MHRLKVTLRGVRPPVWRRIEVSSNIKLSDLADLLEAAMGWLGGHLHAFATGAVVYEIPDEDSEEFETTIDERTVRLVDVLPSVSSKMRWEYDFGDSWEHDIVVEAVEPALEGIEYPRCVGGSRACPPEDCGGPGGYEHLRAVLGDPTHVDHEGVAQWVPPGFDPEAFDAAEATEMMRTPRPLTDW
jgi:hypothetical protein